MAASSNRRRHLRCNYRIDEAHYEWLLNKQEGGCAICGQKEISPRWERRLHVDHCHTSKTVRGLLCSQCNTALGKFKDDTEILTKAIQYLQTNGLSTELQSADLPLPVADKRDYFSTNHAKKINWEIVTFIRKALATKTHNQTQLAELFGISQVMVSRIALQKAWIK